MKNYKKAKKSTPGWDTVSAQLRPSPAEPAGASEILSKHDKEAAYREVGLAPVEL